MIKAARRSAIFIGIFYVLVALMILAIPAFIPYRSFDGGAFWFFLIFGIWCAASGVCAIVGGALLLRNIRTARKLLKISAILGLDYYLMRIYKRTDPSLWDDEKGDAS